MEIFWRLVLGHLLADFTFQTNYIAAWKRRSQWGLLFHVTLHPLFYIILAWPYLDYIWVRTRTFSLSGWACVGVIYVVHYLEDWWRVWNVNHGVNDNFLFYLWDQVIHLVMIFAVVPVPDGLPLHHWPLLGCLFVLTTHCATVTIYYVEKVFYGVDFPPTEEKYMSMLVRLAETACFLLPGYWWILLAAFMAYRLCWHIHKRRVDLSWTGVFLSNVIVVACGLAARAVFYAR